MSPQAAPAREPAARAPGASRVKILVVDDRPDNLLAVETVLAELGQDLICTTSTFEALRCLLREDFALILLDVMMPEMNGFELARQVRALRRARHTPIIFLTAAGRSEDSLFKGYNMGAVDYLVKPVVPEVLRSKVAVFVELAQQTGNVRRYAEMLEDRNTHLRDLMADQSRAEGAIVRLNQSLEARVEELSELNRELEAFSFTVSHDLNGPLARLTGFSRALREEAGGRMSPEGLAHLDRIEAAAAQMGRLIADLLKLARASHGEIRRTDVNLSELTRRIAGELQEQTPERAVEWVIGDGLTVSGDAALMAVLMLSLLNNAWKFTRTGPAARIEFGVSGEAGEPVFYVRDNGIGFSGEEGARLFKPFERLASAREFEGTGVGLATAARIVKRHGGRIWAQGAVGRGAGFYFEIPGPAGEI